MRLNFRVHVTARRLLLKPIDQKKAYDRALRLCPGGNSKELAQQGPVT